MASPRVYRRDNLVAPEQITVAQALAALPFIAGLSPEERRIYSALRRNGYSRETALTIARPAAPDGAA